MERSCGESGCADITKLIEPEAKALGLALVRVKMFGGTSDPTLQVMAERPDTRQLTIDDCADLSRRISDVFDALEEAGNDPIDYAYRLEVSSPGIDRPLTRAQDFEDWKGQEARLNLVRAARGRAQAAHRRPDRLEGDITVIDVRKYKAVSVPFGAIADAKLLMTDKLIAATAPLSTEGADEFEAEEVRVMATAISANKAELIAIADSVAKEKLIDKASSSRRWRTRSSVPPRIATASRTTSAPSSTRQSGDLRLWRVVEVVEAVDDYFKQVDRSRRRRSCRRAP
jgi:ribosome maturation factor RimP